MSRCFPFPPPGYENKARSEDADLLKEEKRKEKNIKRRRKTKRREKVKRKGRKIEVMGNTEKRKTKKINTRTRTRTRRKRIGTRKGTKIKAKIKIRKSFPRKRKLLGNLVLLVQKLIRKMNILRTSILRKRKTMFSYKSSMDRRQFKVVVLMERQRNQNLCRSWVGGSEMKRMEKGSSWQEDSLPSGRGMKGWTRLGSRLVVVWLKTRELTWRGVLIKRRWMCRLPGMNLDLVVMLMQLPLASLGPAKRKLKECLGLGSRILGIFTENKETHVEKSLDNRKMDVHAIRNESKFSGNLAVPNFTGFSNKVEGMDRPLEENNERKEEKEKTKERGDVKLGNKNKDKNGDKKGHKKDKGQEKEKSKEKNEHKGIEKDRLQDINKNEFSAVSSNKAPALSRDTNAGTAFDVNLKKRKLVTNGSLSENETRPVKMPRPASHEPIQNGNKVETLQVPLPTPNRQEGASELKVVNKEHRINGAIHGQPLSVPRPKPLLSTTGSGQIPETSKKPTQADQIAEAFRKTPHTDQIAKVSRKPRANPIAEASKKPPHTDLIIEAAKKAPHPDSKYLSQILTVPKMEEWIESDDNEWLFGSKNPSDRKPGVGSNGVNEELQVWSEARYIESTDVYALPYVIPY